MPNTIVKTKFFHFSQNNSGGSFIVNNNVAHHVIIEAIDANHANQLAEGIGIYFDGCAKDMDCSCCGDRWYPRDDSDGMEVPSVYGEALDIAAQNDWFASQGEPFCHVYYLDGLKQTYRK